MTVTPGQLRPVERNFNRQRLAFLRQHFVRKIENALQDGLGAGIAPFQLGKRVYRRRSDVADAGGILLEDIAEFAQCELRRGPQEFLEPFVVQDFRNGDCEAAMPVDFFAEKNPTRPLLLAHVRLGAGKLHLPGVRLPGDGASGPDEIDGVQPSGFRHPGLKLDAADVSRHQQHFDRRFFLRGHGRTSVSKFSSQLYQT